MKGSIEAILAENIEKVPTNAANMNANALINEEWFYKKVNPIDFLSNIIKFILIVVIFF